MCFILSMRVIYRMKRKAMIASHVQCMNIHITFTVTWSTSLLFVCMWCWTPLSYLCSIVIFWSAHGKSSVDFLNICDNETIFIWNFVYFLRYISYTSPLGGERVQDCSQWPGLNLHMISLWGNCCSMPLYVWSVYARLVSIGPF